MRYQRMLCLSILLAGLGCSSDSLDLSEDDVLMPSHRACYGDDNTFLEVFALEKRIQLETSPECLIANVGKIVIDESSKLLFILDRTRECVFEFGYDGVFRHKIGGKGHGPGEYQAPTGIALIHDRAVAVSCMALQKIFIYDYDGSLQGSFFLGDSSQGYGMLPGSITVLGTRIIASNVFCFPVPRKEAPKAIYTFDRSGKPGIRFGNYDTRLEKIHTQLENGIDVDQKAGRILLANNFDLRISMHDQHGNLLKSWQLANQNNAAKLKIFRRKGKLSDKDIRSIIAEVERLSAIFYIDPYVVAFSNPDKHSSLRSFVFDPGNDSLIVDGARQLFFPKDFLSIPNGLVVGRYSRGIIFAGESEDVGPEHLPLNPVVQFYRLKVLPDAPESALSVR